MHKCNIECEHDLKYCKHCKKVYCTLCGKEWGEETLYIPYYQPCGEHYFPPYTITWDYPSTTITEDNDIQWSYT